MNITFLIGNGFDRNLGLDTTYSDFVKIYKNLDAPSDDIKGFRQHINENEQLWSAAEEALGQYTKEFQTGQGLAFSSCQADFCNHLANYLRDQEQRIDYDACEEKIKTAFGHLQTFASPFPTLVRASIYAQYTNLRGENAIFNFINYNYTYTLDKCIKIIKDIPGLLGSHTYSGVHYRNNIGKICHVHGTIDQQMVFGVNDESQIAKLDIFNGDTGDLCKKFLIKKETNDSQGENIDSIAREILQESSIIYIYGMALGLTDKLWWNRICTWLLENNSRHLILHKYGMSPRGVFQVMDQLAEREEKRKFMILGECPQEKWEIIENRIHVTGHNIFSDISKIAEPLEIIDVDSDTGERQVATVG